MALKTAAKQSLVRAAMFAESLVRARPQAPNLREVRDFLFLQYMMPLGYCVHDTPIYEALRTCMPDARITVATRGLGFETLRHNPFINHLIRTADPLVATRAAAGELKRGLRACHANPAVGITNSSNQRTRITLLNLLAGRHLRLGHTLAPGLYHLPQTYDWSHSLIRNNLHLVENFGCPQRHFEPRVFFTEANVSTARTLLRESGCAEGRPTVVFVTQTSGGQRTGWQAEKFAKVIRYVTETRAFHALFVGTKTDAAAVDSLRYQAGEGSRLAGVSLAGRTSIPELSALLALSDFVLSLDTGTMHVARAAGVPMVVLGPSWQKPREWLPLEQPQVRILRGEDIERAPEGYQLDEIEAEAVIAALDELAALYPASERDRAARVERNLSSVDHARG